MVFSGVVVQESAQPKLRTNIATSLQPSLSVKWVEQHVPPGIQKFVLHVILVPVQFWRGRTSREEQTSENPRAGANELGK
jgi:hypothetical protein